MASSHTYPAQTTLTLLMQKLELTTAKMEQREVLPGTSLQPLEVNQKVLVQDAISKAWKETGTVSSIRTYRRSYEILMESGSTILRNRKFLKPILDTENDSTVAPPNDNEAPHEPRRSPRLSDKKEK